MLFKKKILIDEISIGCTDAEWRILGSGGICRDVGTRLSRQWPVAGRLSRSAAPVSEYFSHFFLPMFKQP